MTSPAVQGSFARHWTVEVLTAPPLIRPARHFTYPRQVPGEEEAVARGALELLVRPHTGGAFLATCFQGFNDSSMPTGIWACPSPDWMCAVSGGYAYLIDTTAPARTAQVPLRPVVDVRAAEAEGLLLFAGFHHIVAWGAEGMQWQSARLSWEGLQLGETRDGHLHGSGWEMFSDRELPFVLDLRTGEHTGGGYLPR